MLKNLKYKTWVGHVAISLGFLLSIGLALKGHARLAEIGWYLFLAGFAYNLGREQGRAEEAKAQAENDKSKEGKKTS